MKKIKNMPIVYKEINYNQNIKPRLIKYNKFKALYNEWEQFNIIKLIVFSFHYNKYKTLIDTYHKFNDFNKLENSKIFIREKLFLNDQIYHIDIQLKSLNDSFIKKSTIAAFYNDNKLNYVKSMIIFI
jgi:hypothetical protein